MCWVNTVGAEQAWQEQSCEKEFIAKMQAFPNHGLIYPGQCEIHSQFSLLGYFENLSFNVIKLPSKL